MFDLQREKERKKNKSLPSFKQYFEMNRDRFRNIRDEKERTSEASKCYCEEILDIKKGTSLRCFIAEDETKVDETGRQIVKKGLDKKYFYVRGVLEERR